MDIIRAIKRGDNENLKELESILFENNVLIKHKLANGYVITVTEDFADRFLDHVFRVINEKINLEARSDFEIRKKELDFYPPAVKKEKVIKQIEILIEDLQPYPMSKEDKEEIILATYTYTDFFNFLNRDDKDTSFNPLNDDVKGFIEDEVLEEVMKLLKKEYDIKDNHKPKRVKKTYKWQGTDTDLPELYQLLKGNNLITKDNTLEQLKAIFTGQPADKIKPIRWHENNKSELLYFIMQLMDKDFIKKGRMDYKRLRACFIQPTGVPFIGGFKQLKSDIDISLSENKQKAIDELVSKFM